MDSQVKYSVGGKTLVGPGCPPGLSTTIRTKRPPYPSPDKMADRRVKGESFALYESLP